MKISCKNTWRDEVNETWCFNELWYGISGEVMALCLAERNFQRSINFPYNLPALSWYEPAIHCEMRSREILNKNRCWKTNLIPIRIHAFLFVWSANACPMPYIMNFLLTSLARSLQRNIAPLSFRTNLAVGAVGLHKIISARKLTHNSSNFHFVSTICLSSKSCRDFRKAHSI